MLDLNAVSANDMRVKLRSAEANAKLPRTPFNLESAGEACAMELLSLDGPEALFRLTHRIAAAYALDHKIINGDTSPVTGADVMNKAVELLVNAFERDKDGSAKPIGRAIVDCLRDMELLP